MHGHPRVSRVRGFFEGDIVGSPITPYALRSTTARSQCYAMRPALFGLARCHCCCSRGDPDFEHFLARWHARSPVVNAIFSVLDMRKLQNEVELNRCFVSA